MATTILNNDYIIVKREVGKYEMLQDLNNPHVVLLIKYNITTTIEEKSFFKSYVATSTDFETLWNNRATQIYVNLMNYFQPIK